jgi:hypothetical protein
MVTPITATLNASASRIARQLFYWISMLLVTLIAAITVMEAFGVYFFPHRSWSEGIDAKVIQNRGGALYYKYIEVKPSDLQIQLPAGVQPTFMGVLATIGNHRPVDARGKVFLRLMTLPEDLFFLALVWLVRGMVLSAWAGQAGEVTPFIRDNVRRLRWMAALLVSLWVYHLSLPTFVDELSFYSALNDWPGGGIREYIPWYLTNGSLAVALLLLILAQVFSYGVRLQKDVEGLV